MSSIDILKEILKHNLPKLHATDNEENPLVRAKLFLANFSWVWYAIEFDSKNTCYGYVVGNDDELGYFTLSELYTVQDKVGTPIEIDIFFDPIRLHELQRRLKRS